MGQPAHKRAKLCRPNLPSPLVNLHEEGPRGRNFRNLHSGKRKDEARWQRWQFDRPRILCGTALDALSRKKAEKEPSGTSEKQALQLRSCLRSTRRTISTGAN